MKKLIILPLLIVAIGVFGQTTVTSKALGDQIVLQKSAFEITPIIATANGDTARSISWMTDRLLRDTTTAFSVTVTLYDKSGNGLSTVNQTIPAGTFAKWAAFISKIDTYILNQKKRLVKQ